MYAEDTAYTSLSLRLRRKTVWQFQQKKIYKERSESSSEIVGGLTSAFEVVKTKTTTMMMMMPAL